MTNYNEAFGILDRMAKKAIMTEINAPGTVMQGGYMTEEGEIWAISCMNEGNMETNFILKQKTISYMDAAQLIKQRIEKTIKESV